MRHLPETVMGVRGILSWGRQEIRSLEWFCIALTWKQELKLE